MVKFVSDSSCDLLEYPGICYESVPLTISTDEKEYIDSKTLNVHEMLNELAAYKGRSRTACPSVDSWLQAFGDADEIYALSLTSALSGGYNSLCAARNLYLETHPDAKILTLDTRNTGPGMRLILEQLVDWKGQGLTFEEISEKAAEYRGSVRLFFALKSLHNLAMNGRISKMAAGAVSALNISILSTASPEGTIETIGKCRGTRKVIAACLEELRKAGYKGGRIRIAHVDNPKLAEELEAAIRNEFRNLKEGLHKPLDIHIVPSTALCSFYAERGAILIGCETMQPA